MKIRNGFVSNSSSASFIISWKQKISTTNDPKEAFGMLAEGDFLYIDEDGKGDDLPSFIEKNTKVKELGVFETEAFTTMMNSMEDFDPRIFVLLAYLASNNEFEYSAKIDSDNG